MILPEDIPYLKTEAERLYREADAITCGGEMIGNNGADAYDFDIVFMGLLRNLARHESRFAAARWLESVGRPGWRFLDGPSALTAEQSARVLHEACLRARDGLPAIVGVLGPWTRNDTNVVRQILVSHPGDPRRIGTGYSIFDVLSDESARLALVARIDADAAKAGWFCL